MSPPHRPRLELGNEPALVADRRRKPDRRQVSARWLAGTLLTGLTSTAMMGIALSAALEGHRSLATPVAAALAHAPGDDAAPPEKGERLVATALPPVRSRQTLELSTMTRDGDREVIRTLPFGYVNMTLAARHATTQSYPPFDAMTVFSDGDAQTAADEAPDAAQIYGAKVESEMSLKVEPFAFAGIDPTETSDEDAETLVRGESATLSTTPVQVASLEPFDPSRFAGEGEIAVFEPGSAFRVVAENVSVAPQDAPAPEAARYAEEIIPLRESRKLADILGENGYEGPEVGAALASLAPLLGGAKLESGSVFRIGGEIGGKGKRVLRLSVYQGDRHVATVAARDEGGFAPAAAPTESQAVAEAFDEGATESPARAEMPSVYDGIYQAALAYGLNERMCRQLVRMLASDVDYQAKVGPDDRLVVFYTMDEGEEEASENSQILYVEADFGGETKRYYRFRGAGSDHYDYYDPDGRSAQQFLLRSPVPNGRFTSPFGTRRHPVLGYSRPHWGVDWAAPSGTPILASGDGVVESAGWTNGYGRQTVLRHANGYETSYSHQSGIARGVSPGSRVRQGQVIGYIGSSGLSTGNHLHYEVIVNGQKVDPMRIKLPSGSVLQGEELETFRRERDRIDALLKDRADAQRVAER